MQMFIRDLDESDEATNFDWVWQFCRTSASLDILSHNFVEFIQRKSTSELVHFVRSILNDNDSAALFLKKIEICHGTAYSNSDTVLECFCQEYGGDVLYYVADALSARRHVPALELELWIQIGVTAMQNGADLKAASGHCSREFADYRGTPFLLLLSGACIPGVEDTDVEDKCRITSKSARIMDTYATRGQY
jgi:hypothetical protein